MDSRSDVLVKTVRDLLDSDQTERALVLVENLHPPDAAEILEALDTGEQVIVLSGLPPDVAAKSFLEMEESVQVELAGIMKNDKVDAVLLIPV